MKRNKAKILALILIAAQLLLLISCVSVADEPAQTTLGETTAATTAATTTAEKTTAVTTTGETTTLQTTSVTTTTNNSSQSQQKGEIKNIVIIIGDGMGLEHIAAGQIYTGKTFAFTKWQHTSVNTNSLSSRGNAVTTTDSAAAATALATGHLTKNGYVGRDATGADLTTILDRAAELDKSTGIVTTDALYGATPAAFSAHVNNRNDYTDIITSQLSSGVDLLCGNKDDTYCVSRKREIEAAGYAWCDSLRKTDEIMSADKAYWQFTISDAALPNITAKALDYLAQDEDGFVLMVEQAHIDKYSHNNDIRSMLVAMQSLNNTVNKVLEWVGDRTDTAIIVTADHETGGLLVSTDSVLSESYYSIGGDDFYYVWNSTGHTNSKVGLFVYGVTADFSKYDYYSSNQLVKNIDVYNLAYDILKKEVN